MKMIYLLIAFFLVTLDSAFAQIKVPVVARPEITIDFTDHLHKWDGFGVNYVETAQTRNYEEWPQEYGGFSLLSESEREEIMELIFGEDGLKPALAKIFLDCYHEGLTEAANDNNDPKAINAKGFEHFRTTQWLLYFNQKGLELSRKQGRELTMLTTLYGPPPWMTQQKFVLGRDLNPKFKDELVEYMVSWVDYLVNEQKLPVKYLSLHNEGDAYYRWPRDGSNPGEDHRDFNMHWKPDLVVDMLKLTRKRLDEANLSSVSMTPGETQTWYRFDEWGYARAIYHDNEALEALGLITSHSFSNYRNTENVYYGDFRNNGIRYLREGKPDLHAWVTSMSWGKMDVDFIENIRRNIYLTGCNAIIPWALIQRPTQWVGGDPNPGTAFTVSEEGNYQIQPGYYFYKQVSRAGQPDMAIAACYSLDPSVSAMAFSSNTTENPNAFLILNRSDEEKEVSITLKGNSSEFYQAFRTSGSEKYKSLGSVNVKDNVLNYLSPPRSATTFYEITN